MPQGPADAAAEEDERQLQQDLLSEQIRYASLKCSGTCYGGVSVAFECSSRCYRDATKVRAANAPAWGSTVLRFIGLVLLRRPTLQSSQRPKADEWMEAGL